MESTATILTPSPTEICGYVIDRVLTEDQSYLAIGPAHRAVVMKKLDPDCLIGSSLHPTVRERLSRVRELAHSNVANLFGVERDGTDAYLMWEYVEGVRLDFYADANHSPREVAAVARELVLAVDLLHMQGIVHGALIGSNVVVTFGGSVRLTHISPLLFTDPAVDIECVWNLLDHAAEQLGDRGKLLAGVVAEAREKGMSLRQLATRLGPLVDSRDSKKLPEPEPGPKNGPRRRALYGAALVAGLGMVLAWGAYRAIESGRFSLPDRVHLPFHAPAEH
jgi:hypothetical protein